MAAFASPTTPERNKKNAAWASSCASALGEDMKDGYSAKTIFASAGARGFTFDVRRRVSPRAHTPPLSAPPPSMPTDDDVASLEPGARRDRVPRHAQHLVARRQLDFIGKKRADEVLRRKEELDALDRRRGLV